MIAVIVQARLGSKRLPGKIMKPLGDMPVLQHVLERCMAIKRKDAVVLALPYSEDHDEPEQIAQNLGLKVVRGPENDVLTRYWLAARAVQACHIMRVTADCPFLDPFVCDAVINAHLNGHHDYSSNVHPRSFEKGLDCEIFTRWALEQANLSAKDKSDREHVTPWIVRNKLYEKVNVESGEPERAKTNWSLDTEKDYERIIQEFERRSSR